MRPKLTRLRAVGAVVAFVALGCFGGEPSPPITSPTGAYVAYGAPSGPEAGEDQYCVVLHVTDRGGHKIDFQTYASDNMKWALAWSGDNTLVLFSSDAGTTTYDIVDGEITLRPDVSPAECAVADDAYARTYGERPRFGCVPRGQSQEPAVHATPR